MLEHQFQTNLSLCILLHGIKVDLRITPSLEGPSPMDMEGCEGSVGIVLYDQQSTSRIASSEGEQRSKATIRFIVCWIMRDARGCLTHRRYSMVL